MHEFGARVKATVRIAVLVAGVAAIPCGAQQPRRLDLGGMLQAGGEAERYLRMLSLTDTAARESWTSGSQFTRPASSGLVAGDHPWRSRFPADSAPTLAVLRPSLGLVLNSAFPVQAGIGPAWHGRGATVVAQWGAALHWRRLSAQVAPVAFLAQNAATTLADNGQAGSLRFGDARYPRNIDYPQRFGDGGYGRVDLGTSTVRLDLGAVEAGVSSAPTRWGPSLQYPLVLGPGAGGIPHYFLGTARPVNVGIGHARLRLVGARLAQSEFSAAPAGQETRFGSAAIVTFVPRGLDGLELGFDRFFESSQPFNVRRALLPLGLSKLAGSGTGIDQNEIGENQLASAFFRWVVPTAGVEVYGEWFRDDYSGTLRTFSLVPDDLSAFSLGLQRTWRAGPDERRLFRFEIVNGELSAQARISRGFDVPLPPYIHVEVLQGHTHRGMMLGSAEAYGGAGWRVALDSYTPRGRRTLGLERTLRFDWLPTLTLPPSEVRPDVLYGLRAETVRFAGEREYAVTVMPMLELNRNLEPRRDAVNLHVALSMRGW